MPKGAMITLQQRYQNGFYYVSYKGQLDWAHHDYIVKASTTPDPVIIGTARTTANVNLRSGPSTSHQILRVVSAGTTIQISGTVKNGFRYATTTVALNLRAEPSLSARVLLVMPEGARVRLLEGGSGQFRKVSYNGTVGWAAYAYLNWRVCRGLTKIPPRGIMET